MIHVRAAGGVVHRKKRGEHQVLLIYRNNKWDLPKGKKEEGETMQECARREVSEETGLPLPSIEYFLTTTVHQYIRGDNIYQKETHWFAMKAKDITGFKPQQIEGITKVEWIEWAQATERVAFDNLRQVLRAL